MWSAKLITENKLDTGWEVYFDDTYKGFIKKHKSKRATFRTIKGMDAFQLIGIVKLMKYLGV